MMFYNFNRLSASCIKRCLTKSIRNNNLLTTVSNNTTRRMLYSMTNSTNQHVPLYNITQHYCFTTLNNLNSNTTINTVDSIDSINEDDSESTEEAIERVDKFLNKSKVYELKGVECGFKYDKHEPTLHGDWSHMGRVTDF